MNLIDRIASLIGYEKRGLDIPATPISATNLGGGSNLLFNSRSDAGISVNEETALTCAAVYAAVSLISDTIGYLDVVPFQQTGDSKRRAYDNELYRLLLEPNDAMNGFTLRQIMTSHALTWGNGYAYIERDDADFSKIISIKPLLPDRTYPYRLLTGELTYTTRVNGTLFNLKPYEVLHIKSIGFTGLTGLSPIQLFRQTIGKQLAFDKFGAKIFANGLNANGVLSHPGQLSKDAQDRLRENITSKLTGLDNSHKLLILEEGLTFQKISIDPDEAQFLDSMKFGVTDIARIYRVPPHLIGDLSRSTNNNVEQQSLDFKTNCLNPWVMQWEQELNRKLLSDDDKAAGLSFKFDFRNLLRGDSTATANYYKSLSSFLTINEIRAALDENPIANGDVILVQSQNVTLDSVVNPPLVQAPSPGPADPQAEPSPTDAGNSPPDVQADDPGERQADIAGRQALDAQFRSTFAYALANKCNADQLSQLLAPYMADVRSLAARECGQPLPTNAAWSDWVRQYCTYMAKRIGEGTDEGYEQRRCRSAITRETYADCGLKKVRWAGGSLHGQTVGIGEAFTFNEKRYGHPPIDNNCLGEIIPV